MNRDKSMYSKLFIKKDEYPDDIQKQIEIYSITGIAKIVGSFSYRSYNAGDIDIIETLHIDNKDTLINTFKCHIKRIVTDIDNFPEQYFCEVKMGLDHLYSDLNYGECKNNIYRVDKSFFELMKLYHNNKFFNDDEYANIINVEKKTNRDQKDYEIMKNTLRMRYTLRWTFREIKRGYKTLVNFSGKYKYSIEDAVREKSKINIEGIFLRSYNIYSDCSNYFILSYTTKYGNVGYLNMDFKSNDNIKEIFKESLRVAAYDVMYSKIHCNLFKSVKRIMSYAIYTKNEQLVIKAYKVINSLYGKMYVLISQLTTLVKLLKIDNKYIDLDIVNNQVQNIIFELKNLINIPCDKIYSNNNNFSFRQIVFQLQQDLDSNYGMNALSEKLYNRAHELFIILNTDIKNIMIDSGLYPIPSIMIPKQKPF